MNGIIKKIMYIYSHFHDDMFRFAEFRLKEVGYQDCSNEAEDIVQESFVKIVMYINSVNFDLDDNTVKAYVLSIVANKINDFLKQSNMFIDIDCSELVSDDNFIERLLLKERCDAVFEAIKKLSDIYKITFMYRYQFDMSVKEISGLIDVPVKTVNTRLLRGRKMLYDLLGGGDDKDE